MVFKINGVNVVFIGVHDATEKEAKNYVDYVRENIQSSDSVTKITVTLCDDGMVDVDYELHGEKFERIRRITGYLSGTLDSWNDSKRAEERDRVKHGRM